MTKLKFINKEIDQTIDEIKLYKGNIKYFSENNYGEKLTNFQKENLKDSEKTLSILLQIKNILEAWEVVKPNIQEETQLCESILGKYYRHTLVIKHRGYDSCENKTEYNTLLKALEVE